jgi:outer membrane protein assembly factor BamB
MVFAKAVPTMRTTRVSLLLVAAVLHTSCGADEPTAPPAPEMIFVAVEGDGVIAALDAAGGSLLAAIDLTEELHGETVRYDVHNVQAAPDGRMVWATAMPKATAARHAMPDVLVGVDVWRLEVRRRIELGLDVHAAHVVVAGGNAYVSGTNLDQILVVDLDEGVVTERIALPAGAGPHGVRLLPDAGALVVAGMGGSLHLVDLASGGVESWALPGRAVQAAALPDGSATFATIYDTRQVARLDLASRTLTLFDLPAGAAGPVQLYPTPDSAHLWVADQGMLDGDPAGAALYRLDAATGAVDLTAAVAAGPHGVVVNQDGTRVWTTTVVDGAVQAVDGATGQVLSTTPVGVGPNGLTCLFAGGVMP